MDLRAKRLAVLLACVVAGSDTYGADAIEGFHSGCSPGAWTYKGASVTLIVNYTSIAAGTLHIRNSAGGEVIPPTSTAGGSGTLTFGPTHYDPPTSFTGTVTIAALLSATSFVTSVASYPVSGGQDITAIAEDHTPCSVSVADNAITLTYTVNGPPPCGPGSITVVNRDGDTGGEFASHGFCQGSVFVNGTPGLECTFQFGDISGESQQFGIPLGSGADGGAIVVSVSGGSQEYAADYGLGKTGQGAPLHYAISGPTTWHCGDNITITITWTGGNPVPPTPTPSPGTTPTPQPSATASATASPPPTPVPVPTPASNPNNGYAPPTQSTPFPGASPGNVFVSNPNNFYGPVKQAMEDADLADKAPTEGGGAFNINNGTHDQGNYTARGHLDDVQGQLTDLNTKKATVVSGITGKIGTLVSDVGAISGQTFGSVSSIGMNFNAIGHAPAVGIITLPTSINLTPWLGMIGVLRSILAWLIRIAFFVLVFRLFAAQGVRA